VRPDHRGHKLDRSGGQPKAADNFNGNYIGKRVLTKGSTERCAPSQNATIDGEVLRFTDGMLHNFAIGFAPHPDGSFGLISTAIGGFVLIQGHIVGSVLDADVANGPSEHHWHLTKNPS
jgi:hypothetical protein